MRFTKDLPGNSTPGSDPLVDSILREEYGPPDIHAPGPSFNHPGEAHGAFSPGARIRMLERAGSVCEVTGYTKAPLQAAHLNHDKRTNFYNDINNGLIVADVVHAAMHLYFKERPHILWGRYTPSNIYFQWNNMAIDGVYGSIMSHRTSQGIWRGSNKVLTARLDDYVRSHLHIWEKLEDRLFGHLIYAES